MRGFLQIAIIGAAAAGQGALAFAPPLAAMRLARGGGAQCSSAASARPACRLAGGMRMGLNEDLWEAAECGQDAKVAELIKAGAEVNSKDPEKLGQTALMRCAFQGHPMVIDQLMSFGADPNIGSVSGSTALHYAAAYGHKRAVSYLLQYGADAKIKNEDNETALDVALFKGRYTDRVDFTHICAELDAAQNGKKMVEVSSAFDWQGNPIKG
mmetsp:Transcript_58707/g.138623  ORF Transcript_58707/g.138623 Transcript_58707/m.138623 type:complete len:212 (-) Transcript_58707:351-986(-)